MAWFKPAVKRVDHTGAEDPRVTELKRMLLLVGGDGFQVAGVIERDLGYELDRLLSIGELIDGTTSKVTRMDTSGCHSNSATLALENNWVCWTGLALSNDGCWRVHSWVMNGDNVIETTEPRLLYFGIPLSPEEAEDML